MRPPRGGGAAPGRRFPDYFHPQHLPHGDFLEGAEGPRVLLRPLITVVANFHQGQGFSKVPNFTEFRLNRIFYPPDQTQFNHEINPFEYNAVSLSGGNIEGISESSQFLLKRLTPIAYPSTDN